MTKFREREELRDASWGLGQIEKGVELGNRIHKGLNPGMALKFRDMKGKGPRKSLRDKKEKGSGEEQTNKILEYIKVQGAERKKKKQNNRKRENWGEMELQKPKELRRREWSIV